MFLSNLANPILGNWTNEPFFNFLIAGSANASTSLPSGMIIFIFTFGSDTQWAFWISYFTSFDVTSEIFFNLTEKRFINPTSLSWKFSKSLLSTYTLLAFTGIFLVPLFGKSGCNGALVDDTFAPLTEIITGSVTTKKRLDFSSIN